MCNTSDRKFISSDEAVIGKTQHKKPCSDCPWRRDALRGWLGSATPMEWVQIAHGESYVECHTLLTKQCAGLAVYRANVCKSPRDPSIMRLDSDKEKVFSGPQEFLTHHTR